MNACRSVLIAANPKSGSGPAGELVQSLANNIRLRGFQADVIYSLDDLRERADQLHHQRHLACIVCAGGDGTVSVVANLVSHDIPLLIFPLGTENLLAKHWGLTSDIESTCTTLVGGRTILMDVGLANGKIFLVLAGCGFDAEVVRQMHSRRSGHITRWSYTLPIIRSIARYPFPQIAWHGQCSANCVSDQSAWIFVFNVPRYGANLKIYPDADPTDGKLDLCTFKSSGIFAGIRYLLSVWRGSHLSSGEFRHEQIRKLTIEAPLDNYGQTIEVPYQLDGDPGGILPLTLELQPARLRLIVPATTAASDPIPVMPLAVSSA